MIRVTDCRIIDEKSFDCKIIKILHFSFQQIKGPSIDIVKRAVYICNLFL